jgi:hypothetical protein
LVENDDSFNAAQKKTPPASLSERGGVRTKSVPGEADFALSSFVRLLKQLHRIDEGLQHPERERDADGPPDEHELDRAFASVGRLAPAPALL